MWCLVLALGVTQPAVKPGWLSVARAIHATKMKPDHVLDAMPSIAASFEVSGGGVTPLSADCTGSQFSLSWQTKSYFKDDPEAERIRVKKSNPVGGGWSYEHMRDDTRRTPLYYAAIRKRLAEADEPLTVLDLGTGALALLALEAARAGAKKVYAIEHEPVSAKLARAAIAEAGFSGVIEVFEGYSTEVTLPEKVDVLISEVVGSMASEEGLYATIADAHARHVKRPTEPSSWIPYRSQTWGAPSSYALHYGLGRPDYDWFGMPGPPRIAADDAALQVLATPKLVEEIDFTDPHLPVSGQFPITPEGGVSFTIDAERLDANAAAYAEACTAEWGDDDEAEEADEEEEAEEAASFAAGLSTSLSGFAFWPRLVLDPEASIVVECRGEQGEPKPSSWGVLLPLLSERPLAIAAGETLVLKLAVHLEEGLESPPRYVMEGEWRR